MARFDINEMAMEVAEMCINDVTYEGKTIREWIETIKIIPVKHGHWVAVDDNLHYCSKCKHDTYYFDSTNKTPYCPWCGAKMDGDPGEEP